MAYRFTVAARGEIQSVRDLIQKRIDWMDEVGLSQWNTSNYWEAYPMAYFEKRVEQGALMVLRREDEERIIGAVVLVDEDDFWEGDDTPAYYIHNLVTALDVKGAGAEIVSICEEIVRQRGCDRLRLDCTRSNGWLNTYYEEKGYVVVGEVNKEFYKGIKREKLLK